MYNDTSQSSLELTVLPWQSLIEGGGGEATMCTTTIETLSLRADKASPLTPNYAWATCLTLHDPDTISISISISITLPIFIPNSLSIALPICMSLYMPLSSACSAQCPCPFPSLFPFALSCIPSHDLLLHIISLLHSVRVCVCLLMRP